MLRKWIVAITICLSLLSSRVAIAQYYLFRNNDIVSVDIGFAVANQELKRELFFNVLKIKNSDASTSTFTVDFTAPSGWQIIGDASREITLAAYDSILIPIRVAVPKQAKGEVAYSIIGTIKDRAGNVVKNEYCYVKIPKNRDLGVRYIDRYIFMSSTDSKSEFRIALRNGGNLSEQLYFNMEAGSGLLFARSYSKSLAADLSLPPFSDTIVSFPVLLNVSESQLSRGIFPVNIKATTQDTSFNSTVWFKQLSSVQKNSIDESEKALVVDFSAQGLFNDQNKPNYSVFMYGGVAITESDNIYYSYRNRSSASRSEFLKYSNSYFGYKNNFINVKVGDVINSYELAIFGRGVDVDLNLGSLRLSASAVKNVFTQEEQVGSEITYKVYKGVTLLSGAGYSKQSHNVSEQFVGYGGVILRLSQKQSIQGTASLSDADYRFIGQGRKQAMGVNLAYNLTGGRYSLSVSGRTYPRDYIGYLRGRSWADLILRYTLNDRNTLVLTSNYEYYSPRNIGFSGFDTSKFYSNSRAHINYQYLNSADLIFYGDVGVDKYASDNYSSIEPTTFFGVNSYNAVVGARISFSSLALTLSPSYKIGFGEVFSYSRLYYGNVASVDPSKRIVHQVLSATLRGSGWGSMFSYYNGARTMFEYFNKFYSARDSRYLRLTSYLDRFIYKDILELRLQLMYSNNIISGSTATTISGNLNYYLPSDWKLYFMTVYSLQSRKENGEEAQTKYATMYVETGVHKEFNWAQPSKKFFDIQLVFFKDFNGNKRKDDNEPGIRDVLVQLEYVGDSLKKNNTLSYNGETLSDQYGMVKFINIPRGVYKLQYDAVGKDLGTFSKDQDTPYITLVGNTTMELPYVEKNKVFGKIVLNRSKLSALGKVDLSNVRISAKDSQGRIYSTLTDAEGYFVLYAPVTDNYNVSVSNVYYENFDLRQGNYLVHFNGYKQFEVNFVFDEKIRTINFTKSGLESNLASGVMEIRRTNLRGIVKDAVTLKPVTAKINIINRKNNQIVASITSSRATGEYGVSFAAGNDYAIEIVADGYWYLSENMDVQQVTTFEDVSKDYTLTAITIGASLELKNLLFDSKSSELTPEGIAEITRLVGMLKENPTVKIQIQGHCDDLEALDNPAIGDARARNVARYLVERGFSKFETKNMGNTVPVAQNDTEENRRLNRRVDIVVTNK